MTVPPYSSGSSRRPRRILLIAFHFPPFTGSSGIQRTLGLVRYLPAAGWDPIVLSAHRRAYENTSEDLLAEIPSSVLVERAFALDTARDLTIFGRYPAILARPDRWVSWYWRAVPAGLRLIQRFSPSAIWSTYPIATAHLIGAELQRRSGLPWIADFRDPMAQDGYPSDPRTWRRFKEIEEDTASRAARLVFVTPGAMKTYVERYPDTPREKFACIENGYDEVLFRSAEKVVGERGPLNPGRLTLLHSGVVYPSERDPTALFAALSELRRSGVLSEHNFRLRFRAPLHDQLLLRLGDETAILDLIEVLPPLPYVEALAEMMRADALVVMQAANCNEQIPAKVYEYLRARRPILALADPAGDTAHALEDAGVRHIAKLEDKAAVEAAVADFYRVLSSGRAPVPDQNAVVNSSRESRARQFVDLLGQVAG
jgi:hypothetical protein